VPPFLVSLNHSDVDRVRGIDGPMPTAMPQGNPALCIPPFIVKLRSDESAEALDRALSTVTAGGVHHGLLVPFLTSYHSTSQGSALSEPVPTQDTRDRHALVFPTAFLMSYYARLSGQQAAVSGVDDPVPTVPGRAVHYLAQPGETPQIEDCGFRMLQPHEIGAAMAFPASYKVLGNQRQQVKQYGLAVTPPVMEVLVRRCIAVLDE
jgi:DNA (cytosine-5)-methyltransferase 1